MITINLNNKIINIMGIDFKISVIENLFDDNNKVLGFSDYAHSEIKLESNQDNQNKLQTLVHEITHVILWNTGYDDLNANEQLIVAFGNVLYQVLADNDLNELVRSK
jgi:Zn-dependent peptidase ImmA (M78 family)